MIDIRLLGTKWEIVMVNSRVCTGVLGSLGLFFAACSAAPEKAEEVIAQVEITQAEPNIARVVLDEDWVKVVRFDVPPGKELPEHAGGNRVMYWLTDAEVKMTEAGEESTANHRMGTAQTHSAGNHTLTNIGESVASFVVFTRKAGALPEGDAGGVDVGDSDLEISHVALDDDVARVIRVTLIPEQTTSIHGGGARIIYALANYTLGWEVGDGDQHTKEWKTGQAHYHGPGAHRATNIGQSNADYVVVIFKQ